MRKVFFYTLVICVIAVALPVAAQEDGTISMLIRIVPKAGMTEKWEEGAKKHMQFHGQKGDSWGWAVWEVVSGDKTGEFVVGTYGHEWADFDNIPVSGEEDEADAKTNIDPYTESISVKYANYMPEASHPPEGEFQPKLLSVYTIHVKPEHEQDYVNAIGKIPEALKKADSSVRYFFSEVVIGGRMPAYRVLFPVDSFAALGPPDTPFRKMLEDAYGSAEADSILETLAGASYGSDSELLVHREDLSYVPSSTSN